MGDRTLPPQVEGHPQGRLDLIIGRPAVFPPPKASQSFIFSFRWWGDTRPCILRLPPGKSESRITYYVTCGPKSFRQYLCDAGSLHVGLKIGGGGNEENDEEDKENISQVTQSPRRIGESPRQTVLRRQLRLKKGWQDGDVVGSFLLPDLKLNSRGDCVSECRIVDSSADVIGNIVVTMIFLEGTLEDFQEIKIQREEESTVQQKMEETKSRPRSGIPVRGSLGSATQKSTQEGHRSRSGSFKESHRQRTDRLKSPKRQPGTPDFGGRGKGQEVLQQSKKNEGLSQIGVVHPEVVRRERKQQDRRATRERPASWGLYPLLDGADPHSLVESGAVRAQDLPALMQVLEGRSPNIDLSNLDPETQKLLDGLDLSMSFSGVSAVSSGGSFAQVGRDQSEREKQRGHAYSMFKGSQNDITEVSGISSTSGVWPLDTKEKETQKGKRSGFGTPKDKGPSQESSKIGIKKSHPESVTPTKIPMSQMTVRTPSKACRSLLPQSVIEKQFPTPEKDGSMNRQITESISSKPEKLFPSKSGTEDDGSVLVLEVGTLTLSPSMLPHRYPDKSGKISGVRVMHLSRVCYLTTLDVSFPHLELPPDWDISQTCASRQLSDNEVNYSAREVLRLPPASAIEILRGQLVIKCVCRRLGERNSQEVGSAGVSLMDVWQLNGSEVQVPLFRSETLKEDDDSLTRKHSKKSKKKDDNRSQPLAHLSFTAKLALAVDKPALPKDGQKSIHKTASSKGKSDVGTDLPPSYIRSKSPKGKQLEDEDYLHGKEMAGMQDSSSSIELDRIFAKGKEDSVYLCPVPAGESTGPARLNSIYIPTPLHPQGKAYPSECQQSLTYRQVEMVKNVRSTLFDTKVVSSDNSGYPCYGSFLTGINGHEVSNNQPVENGGESPCIQTIPDFHADLIHHGAMSRSSAMDFSDGEFCRVHLEIIKGRNLPWIEGPDQAARPPNCYVRTNIGSLSIQTNVCTEMDNPVWNFAADVLLPYSQLTQTEGSLIFKIHHTHWEQHSSPDDPLLGFVCVDATSIWSGHVSLCGWYPLLDLLGCVRGHIKVSLTPHEPPQAFVPPRIQRYPVNLQERPLQRPSHDPHLWRQSYPQQMSLDRDILSSPRHFLGQGSGPSSCRVPFHPRYANTIPQSSPRFSRKNMPQEKHSDQRCTAHSMNGLADQSHDSSVYSKYSSVISTNSVIVDVPALNEIAVSKRKPLAQDMTPQRLEVTDKTDQNNRINRSSSAIPIYSPGKEVAKCAVRSVDSRNLNSILPEVLYQENALSQASAVSQDYGRNKGTVTVKGVSKEISKKSQSSIEDSKVSTSTVESESSRGSVVPKDSIIVAHTQMQKRDQGREKTLEERMSHNIAQSLINKHSDEKFFSREQQSKDSQMAISASSSSSSSIGGDPKPSSCLKVPGSPSLRAKHVTFANKLVQHKAADAKGGTHSLQDRLSRSPSGLPRLSQTSPLSSQDAVTPHIQRSKENVATFDSTRSRSSTEARYADGSDLQVVPCREGDTQVVTTTVSVQGSRTMYSVSGDRAKGSTDTQLSSDKNRSDLIMSFSWMNQTSDCDTPCVSYIESKHAMHGAVAAAENGSVSSAKHRKESKGFGEKSRKFRSRLAANFPLK